MIRLFKNECTILLVCFLAFINSARADDSSANNANNYPVQVSQASTIANNVNSDSNQITISQPSISTPSQDGANQAPLLSQSTSNEMQGDTSQVDNSQDDSNWESLQQNNSNSQPINNDIQPANTSAQNGISAEAVSAPGDEHVVWDKRPISFTIPIGKERMISFPGDVDLGYNPTDSLSVMINAGTIYFKALKPFSPTRVIVILKDTGQKVLLDISSSDSTDDTPVDVVMQSQASISQGDNHDSASTTLSLSYIDLLRFAIQQLYAPERLAGQPNNILRTPMYTEKSVTLLYGANTIAYPEASWRGDNYFVTAVIVKNALKNSIILDPRQLHGRWLASSFYPTNVLAPRGKVGDQTTLFVVSDEPFGQALVDMPGEN